MRNSYFHSLERIPQNIKDQYPNFEEFLKQYYLWYETNYSEKADFLKVRNIDETDDSFIGYFIKNFAPGFPGFIGDDNQTKSRHIKQEFIKHVNEFFKTKGTEEAIKVFFKILFNDNVEIFYPRDEIFTASESTWTEQKSIKVSRTGIAIEDIRKKILWFGTTGRFYVDEVVEYPDGIHAQLIISGLIGNIESQTKVRQNKDSAVPGFELTLKKQFTKFLVLSPGYGHHKDDQFSTSTAYGNVVCKVTSVNRGTITSVNITSAGTGYSSLTDTVTVSGGDGFPADIRLVTSSGQIVDTEIFYPGRMYSKVPALIINTENGENGLLTAVSTNIGGIRGIDIIESGINTPNTLDITLGNASVRLISGILSVTSGNFSNFQNFLSSKNTVFEDEHYYQLFSYVLKTNTPSTQFETFFKLLAHPVGMKAFYQLTINSSARSELRNAGNNILKKILAKFVDYFDFKPVSASTKLSKRIHEDALVPAFRKEIDSIHKFVFNSRPISHFKNDVILHWMNKDSNPYRLKKMNIQPDAVIIQLEESGVVSETVLGQQILGQ